MYQNSLIKEAIQGIAFTLGVDAETIKLYPLSYNPATSCYGYPALGVWVCKEGDLKISTFCLEQLPGCCGIGLSHQVIIYDPYKNKGIGRILHEFRIKLAKHWALFERLLCTDVADNTPQQKILNRFGWKTIHAFHNPKTDNIVNINILELNNWPSKDTKFNDHPFK